MHHRLPSFFKLCVSSLNLRFLLTFTVFSICIVKYSPLHLFWKKEKISSSFKNHSLNFSFIFFSLNLSFDSFHSLFLSSLFLPNHSLFLLSPPPYISFLVTLLVSITFLTFFVWGVLDSYFEGLLGQVMNFPPLCIIHFARWFNIPIAWLESLERLIYFILFIL